MTPDPPLLCFCRNSFPLSRGDPKPLKKSSKGLPLKKSSPNLSQGLMVIVFSVVTLTTAGWTFLATSTKALPRDFAVVIFSLSSLVVVRELARSLFIQKKRPKRRATKARPIPKLLAIFLTIVCSLKLIVSIIYIFLLGLSNDVEKRMNERGCFKKKVILLSIFDLLKIP